jgi:hypothetical protein
MQWAQWERRCSCRLHGNVSSAVCTDCCIAPDTSLSLAWTGDWVGPKFSPFTRASSRKTVHRSTRTQLFTVRTYISTVARAEFYIYFEVWEVCKFLRNPCENFVWIISWPHKAQSRIPTDSNGGVATNPASRFWGPGSNFGTDISVQAGDFSRHNEECLLSRPLQFIIQCVSCQPKLEAESALGTSQQNKMAQ